MLAEIALKLRRSRSTNPIFGDRVTIVADRSRAMEYTALAYPAAYVTFVEENAEPQPPGANENRQRVVQHWGVIIGLEATADIRAQAPSQSIETIRPAVFRAIYNWSPDKEHGNLWYESCELIALTRANTFWLMIFGTYYWVCGEEGEGETEEQFDPLPDFEGINLLVDYIDPHDPGLPPSQEYDPGSRWGPPPWRTGPEGRIELAMSIDLPPRPAPLPANSERIPLWRRVKTTLRSLFDRRRDG